MKVYHDHGNDNDDNLICLNNPEKDEHKKMIKSLTINR